VNDKPKESKTISVNIKLLKHFNHMFHNASDVKWEQVNDAFVATFVNGETLTKTFFNKKWQIIYTMDFISQMALPRYDKKLIAYTSSLPYNQCCKDKNGKQQCLACKSCWQDQLCSSKY
jgi:hypothetical protein